jgi:hypothetical protein
MNVTPNQIAARPPVNDSGGFSRAKKATPQRGAPSSM